MLRQIAAVALTALVSLTLTATAGAAIEAKTLKRLKRATVFVSLGQHRKAGSGSGFLVYREGKRGLVVTNAHVASKAADGGLRVIFNSGTRRADSIPAKVVALSRSRDLAVLELQAPKLPEPLQISPNARVHETQTVHIVGFPFGKGFATNRETPVVTISQGTVSSQRLDVNDQARLMQIDGDLNPGNSGGPIVDGAGQVVGVAVATVRQTNIGFAIPLAPVVEMLAGTLTDVHAELSSKGVRVSGHLLDPHGRFKSARLNLRAMKEDAVLDLLSEQEQWQAIAPGAKAVAFASTGSKSDAGNIVYSAVHELPKKQPKGTTLVAQIIVKAKDGDRYLPPFRVEASNLSVTLSGPDVRPAGDSDDKAGDKDDSERAKATDKVATVSASESEFDELFTRSGIAGLITSMASAEESEEFDQSSSDEDERTVRERLREIIAAQWDEERIKRTFVRSFEATPNADAQRRATELLDLPAMKLLHLTADRLKALTNKEADELKKWHKRSRVSFDKRLELMREIDEKRKFSLTRVDAVSTSVSSLSRLLNEIKTSNTRMSSSLLQRDIERVVAGIEVRIRSAIPIMLLNQYKGVDEKDLRDYLKQLDSIAMRWFADNEFAAHSAVIKAQFNEAEDEIVQLFKEVRRESLGLAEAPELKGKNNEQVMDALIQAYGKAGLIQFVLKKRGGEINIVSRGGVKSQFGRPAEKSVIAKTLVADLKAMKMQPKAFADALAQFLVDQAYKEKRLTSRGQRSRLIAALRDRRRAKALRGGNSRRGRRARTRALRQMRNEQRSATRQCRTDCRSQNSSCGAAVKRSSSLCRSSAPSKGKQRSRILRQCSQQRSRQRSACSTRYNQCRSNCQ